MVESEGNFNGAIGSYRIPQREIERVRERDSDCKRLAIGKGSPPVAQEERERERHVPDD